MKRKLIDKVETFQRDVLEITDEFEQLGQMTADKSKVFSKNLLNLSNVIPPEEFEFSINNLENEINKKLAEMETKIKNLKSKKKKKVHKKTTDQRFDALSC